MPSILFRLIIIWCLCYSCVIGHKGRNLRKLNKKIADLEKKFSKRIGILQNRIQTVEASVEGKSANVRDTGYNTEELGEVIRTLFDTTLKMELLQSLRIEMETTFAGKFAQELLKEFSNKQSSSGYERLEREIKNIWQGLQVQKTSFRHLRTEMTSLLYQNDNIHHSKIQTDRDICFKAAVLDMCLQGNRSIAESFKGRKEGVVFDGDTNKMNGLESTTLQPEKEANFDPDSYAPRKLLIAGRGGGDNPVYVLDFETNNRRKTTLSFKSLSSLVYHPGLRRMFYSLLVPKDTLGSVLLNNSSNIMYDVGNVMITNLALDLKIDALFYTTNYPWSVKVFDIKTRSYSLVANFPASQTPGDIALDVEKKLVFVLIGYHTSSTAVVCYNYMGTKKPILNDLVTQPMTYPFSAIGFSSEMLMYSRNAVLKYRSLNHRSGSGERVVQLPGKVDDIAAWGDTCYIALEDNRGIIAVNLRDKKKQRIGSLGIGGRRSLLSLV